MCKINFVHFYCYYNPKKLKEVGFTYERAAMFYFIKMAANKFFKPARTIRNFAE